MHVIESLGLVTYAKRIETEKNRVQKHLSRREAVPESGLFYDAVIQIIHCIPLEAYIRATLAVSGFS